MNGECINGTLVMENLSLLHKNFVTRKLGLISRKKTELNLLTYKRTCRTPESP